MSTKINIDNYEAFYLDYLEGNLGEADTALLLAFLDEHPELALEDEMLTYLPEEDLPGLDMQSKAQLRFTDTTQRITADNIEMFLTASVEKQLTAEKTMELQAFLGANPLFLHDLDLYRKSILQADPSLVYPTKKGLKKGGRIVPMYLGFAAAAASVALIFGWLNYTDPGQSQVASSKKTPTEIKPGKKDSGHNGVIHTPQQGTDFHTVQTPEQAAAYEAGPAGPETAPFVAEVITTPNLQVKEKETYPKLDPNQVKEITNRRLLREIDVPALAEVTPPDAENQTVNFAMVGVDQMKNPIKPITNRIGEVLKQDVDFRTSKAARKKEGGFYVKIGKFAISRKVYDHTSVATK